MFFPCSLYKRVKNDFLFYFFSCMITLSAFFQSESTYAASKSFFNKKYSKNQYYGRIILSKQKSYWWCKKTPGYIPWIPSGAWLLCRCSFTILYWFLYSFWICIINCLLIILLVMPLPFLRFTFFGPDLTQYSCFCYWGVVNSQNPFFYKKSSLTANFY